MRLRGWHVEGFGLLHDFRIEKLSGGLTIVFGPNEAGKTSLLAFIRGVLFGYPDRRQKERHYPPLRGGRHGGRLFVESDQSTWTVERFASPSQLSITQPNGSLGSDVDLRRLLGGVDADLYRNVFAFSLAELQELKSLEVEGVRERIFAAGVVGAGRSARTAMKALAAERAEIGRKRGGCLINDLRKRVDDLDEKLRQAKSRATRHPDLRRAADELDEKQKRIGRDLTDARREMAHLDALLSAWPDWDERGQAEQELLALANTPDVAGDLATRLDASLAAAQLQRERHEERAQAVNSLTQQLGALVPDERLAAVSTEVKRLNATVPSVRAQRERLGDLQGKHVSLSQRVAEEAPRLGAGWTPTSVREFNASIPAAQAIADWGERLRMAEQTARDAEAEAARRVSSAQELADEALRRTQVLEAAPSLPDTQALAERDGAVRRLRTSLAQLVELRTDLRAATQGLTEAERRATEALDAADAKDAERKRRADGLEQAPPLPTQDDLARLERAARELRLRLVDRVVLHSDRRSAEARVSDRRSDAERSRTSINTSNPRRLLLGTAAVLCLLAAGLAFASQFVAAGLAVLIAVLAAILATSWPSGTQAAQSDVSVGIADAERRVQELAAQVEGIETSAFPLATRLGFSSLPDQVALDAKADEIAGQSRARQDRDRDAEAVRTLTLEATIARSVANRLRTECAEVRTLVELNQSAHVRGAETSALAIAVLLGFPAIPDPVELEMKAQQTDSQIRMRLERDREATEIEQLRLRAEAAKNVATNVSAVADRSQCDLDETRSGWSTWKVAHGCPESLRPDTAQQFFISVERLRESIAQLDSMDAEMAGITVQLQTFSQTVHDLAERAGVAPGLDTQLAESSLEGLRDRVEADANLRVEQARIGRELEQAGTAHATSERNVRAANEVVTSLFAEAGAADDRDCRVRIETSRQRAELGKTIREAERRLRVRLGAHADAVCVELASGDLQGWEARKQECKGVLARSQPAQEDALRRHQTALEALSTLEHESDVVTLATEREGAIGEIGEALVEWRRLAIAQSLIQGTLRRYELERQPAVLTRAGASFSRITEGRYARLVTREDGIDVIGADGSRLDAALLSRGAAEQLYLCLRLALAAEFGRLAVPLPLVMDDVLVNFDAERARLSAQVLLDATPEHQVLLFTCHQETVDLLIDLDPSVRVITIDRQTPTTRSEEWSLTQAGHESMAPGLAGNVQPPPQMGPDIAEAVLLAIRAAGKSLSRTEILVATGISDTLWTPAIQELRSRGQIVSFGKKRGTTWGLVEWTSAMVDGD